MALPQRTRRAYERRQSRARARIEWFDERFRRGMEISFAKQLDMVAQLLRDKVVANISLPVERSRGKVIQRSAPGEFPRAETTRLMRDIFWANSGRLRRKIGTTLDYGIILEFKMNRSFLRRTFEEERQFISERIRRLN